MRGRRAGFSLTRRERWHCGERKEERFGTDLCSRADAGLISGGEQTTLRAAMRWRCSIRRTSGGREASMAKIGIGVEEKQLVTHLWTRCQNTSNLSCIPERGVYRSAPYRSTGARREEASLSQRYGGRAFPGGESLLIVSKTPWASDSLLLKWALEESGGVNQYPSHLTVSLGEKYRSSSRTPAIEGGERS